MNLLQGSCKLSLDIVFNSPSKYLQNLETIIIAYSNDEGESKFFLISGVEGSECIKLFRCAIAKIGTSLFRGGRFG